MKLFFLALLFSLALAGLASAQDFLSQAPALLAANAAGKGAGDQCCSDDSRDGQICGECAKARQGEGLECRPGRQ